MNRPIIILLSFLLVFSPVASAFSAQMDHGSMQQSGKMAHAEMDEMSDCLQVDQSPMDKSCCQDEQCDVNCQTTQCHSTGKLPVLSNGGNIGSGFIALSLIHARLFNEPVNIFYNTPLRPPIVNL